MSVLVYFMGRVLHPGIGASCHYYSFFSPLLSLPRVSLSASSSCLLIGFFRLFPSPPSVLGTLPSHSFCSRSRSRSRRLLICSSAVSSRARNPAEITWNRKDLIVLGPLVHCAAVLCLRCEREELIARHKQKISFSFFSFLPSFCRRNAT